MPSTSNSYLVSIRNDCGQIMQHRIQVKVHDIPLAADESLGCVRLEQIDSAEGKGKLRVTNLADVDIVVEKTSLRRGEAVEASMPVQMCWLNCEVIAVEPLDNYQLIRGCTPVTDLAKDMQSNAPDLAVRKQVGSAPHPAPSAETLSSWLSALASIQRQAACTKEFYFEAVRAMVDPGGLDAGFLLERTRESWNVVHTFANEGSGANVFQPLLADLVVKRREALVFHASPKHESHDASHPAACFAAPIFDEQMNVAFVLYGSRLSSNTNRRHRIRQLESLWIQLLAESVTAGVVRMKHETDLARQRVLLERVFPVDVVRQLCLKPKIEFPAEEKEVTIMFVDLIDSSSLCESQAPQIICGFLAEVMDAMTEVILEHGGVIVDYYGDGLIAMWNAPIEQPNHAQLACESGLALQRKLGQINSTWAYRLGRTSKFGIGIHTGTAVVGNSGSRHRLKYGPRGLTVTIANRIEKATRKLNQPLLISEATRKQVSIDASAYRLGRFRLRGIDQPTVLHALISLRPDEPANACCLAKHQQIKQLVRDEDFEAAANHLDGCQGCALDELSLNFMKTQLDSLSNFSGSSDFRDVPTGEVISDLR